MYCNHKLVHTSLANGKISVKRGSLPNFSDTAEENKYVQAVSQVDGRVSVLKAILPSMRVFYEHKEGREITFHKEGAVACIATRGALTYIAAGDTITLAPSAINTAECLFIM